jgi:hypothetical protein
MYFKQAYLSVNKSPPISPLNLVPLLDKNNEHSIPSVGQKRCVKTNLENKQRLTDSEHNESNKQNHLSKILKFQLISNKCKFKIKAL